MTDFKLLTYVAEGDARRAGILVGGGETVLDAARALDAAGGLGDGLNGSTVLSLLEVWDRALPALDRIASEFGGDSLAMVGPLASVQLKAPILYPSTIYCAAANYSDHSKEMQSRPALPDKTTASPYFFIKAPRQTVIGPDEALRLPRPDVKVDWEAEIAVVIGRKAKNVLAESAMDYVAGYTIMNDGSARARNFRDDWNFKYDWFGGKSFDTSAPMGPWITPTDQIADPLNLAIKLLVNDEVMQDSSSKFMHFDIVEQIVYLSTLLTLLPGDVISTGTASGVGHPRGLYLKPGDRITINIEGLGTLKNSVVEDA